MTTHALTPAQAAIQKFKDSKLTGNWSQLQKEELLDGLESRVEIPMVLIKT